MCIPQWWEDNVKVLWGLLHVSRRSWVGLICCRREAKLLYAIALCYERRVLKQWQIIILNSRTWHLYRNVSRLRKILAIRTRLELSPQHCRWPWIGADVTEERVMFYGSRSNDRWRQRGHGSVRVKTWSITLRPVKWLFGEICYSGSYCDA